MQSIQQSSVRVLRHLLAAQPTSQAKIAFAWRIVAGQPLASHGDPRWSDDGTLRIRPSNATWASELRSGREVLLERLHELLGRETIARLVIERHDYGKPTL